MRSRKSNNVAVSSGDAEYDSKKKVVRQQPGLGKRMDVAMEIPIYIQVVALTVMLVVIYFFAY